MLQNFIEKFPDGTVKQHEELFVIIPLMSQSVVDDKI